jgi:tRNA(Ile)-lysidine synthase
LDLSHAEMTEWLGANGYSWREDATNGDARYYRNRVRNHLVPVLDSFFPGWETGVLSAATRSALDDDLCHSLMDAHWERVEGVTDTGSEDCGIRCESAAFLSLHPAVRLRFLRDGLALLSPKHRVPSGYLERIAALDTGLAARGECVRISGSGLSFEGSGTFFFWKPDIVQNDKSGYLVYIRSCGAYSAPFGDISVLQAGISVYIDRCPGQFTLPLTVRSRQAGDTVQAADGKQKTLKKLMNEWSVRESDRDLLPVIEENGKIRAVWGGALGYPDWFVQI